MESLDTDKDRSEHIQLYNIYIFEEGLIGVWGNKGVTWSLISRKQRNMLPPDLLEGPHWREMQWPVC